ncbi:MAG: TRAP transporter small permease [Gammaproteobacteria bacterium]|nr:TRAP transporter small permease [Gammaproteobacteria bacterium]
MIKFSLRFIHILEDSLLIGLLMSMILLASGQIILRNFFDTGFVWIDPLLRVLVLWTGLIGATIASRDNRHIRIDLVCRYLQKRLRLIIQVVVGLFTTVVCAIIAWYGAQWVQMDYQDQLVAFAGLPSWVMELIIPLAFALIALRYLFHSLRWLGMLLHDNGQEIPYE